MNYSGYSTGVPLAEILDSIRSGAWGSDVASDERPMPVRVIRNSDISEDRRILIDNLPRRYVNKKELIKSKVTDRDTLLVASGYIGKSARLEEHNFEEPIIASNFVRILSPKQLTDPGYLYYLLGLESCIKYMKRVSAGTSLKNLPTTFFREWKIPKFPPLTIQIKVANILDSIDKPIRTTEELIEKQRALRDSLLDELLTRGLPIQSQAGI